MILQDYREEMYVQVQQQKENKYFYPLLPCDQGEVKSMQMMYFITCVWEVSIQ